MQIKYVIIYSTALFRLYVADAHCIDIHSRIVSQGLHYVPGGTNPCTLCICDKGGPKWCKSVLCSPPQNCKSFQVGSSCCEFKCLDDILSGHDSYKETYEVALRFIATTVTAILSISLLFFLYNRLKRNKSHVRHNHQQADQSTLGSDGYIAANYPYNQTSIGFLRPGQTNLAIRYEESGANYSLWKPPGNYFPPGEAPPPYEEAMRYAHNDVQQRTPAILNAFSTTIAEHHANGATVCRHDGAQPTSLFACPISTANTVTKDIANISSNTRQYVNVPPEPAVKCMPKKHYTNHEVFYENISTLKRNVAERLARMDSTHSDKSRNLRMKRNNCSSNRSGGKTAAAHSALISTSGSSSARLDQFTMSPSHDDTEHTSPRSKTAANLTTHHWNVTKCRPNSVYDSKESNRSDVKINIHRTLPTNLQEFLPQVESAKSLGTVTTSFVANATTSRYDSPLSLPSQVRCKRESIVLPEQSQQLSSVEVKHDVSTEPKYLPPHHSLSQDDEDYRSECENCKTLMNGGTKEYVDATINETMSLQRRPLAESNVNEMAYRNSLTLPANSTKHRAYYPCASINRDWFATVQPSSSEESD